jgi:hypothetical protein
VQARKFLREETFAVPGVLGMFTNSPEPAYTLAPSLLALDVVVGRRRHHKIGKIVAVGLDRAIFTPVASA